jgi:hypothetical protein
MLLFTPTKNDNITRARPTYWIHTELFARNSLPPRRGAVSSGSRLATAKYARERPVHAKRYALHARARRTVSRVSEIEFESNKEPFPKRALAVQTPIYAGACADHRLKLLCRPKKRFFSARPRALLRQQVTKAHAPSTLIESRCDGRLARKSLDGRSLAMFSPATGIICTVFDGNVI